MFNKGTIEIVPDKYDYSPSETVTGKVKLALNAPTMAKKLSITLFAEETDTSSQVGIMMNNSIGAGTQTRRSTVFNVEIPLGGEQEYSAGEYPFSITIPAEQTPAQMQQALGDGVLGAMVGIAGALSAINPTMRTSKRDWYLKADLDIPGMFNDVKNQVQINVAAKA